MWPSEVAPCGARRASPNPAGPQHCRSLAGLSHGGHVLVAGHDVLPVVRIMSAHPGIIWPFPVGDTPDDYEPTDAELGATPPTDPYDSPSYSTLTKGNTK